MRRNPLAQVCQVEGCFPLRVVKCEALCPLSEDSWSGPVRGSDPAGPQCEANGFSGGQQAGPSSMEITALRSAGQQTHNARSQFKMVALWETIHEDAAL